MTTKTAHFPESDVRHDMRSGSERRADEKRRREIANEAITQIERLVMDYGPEWIVQRVADQCSFHAVECASRERSEALRAVADLLTRAADETHKLLGKH